MPVSVAIALASLGITMIVGFTKIIASQARLELKVDLMWSAYLLARGPSVIGGKRSHDPPGYAHDTRGDGPQDE